MTGIINIGHYSTIKLGKRYGDGEYHTISIQKREYGFDVFRNGTYEGYKDFADTFHVLRSAYDAGYKTIEKKA